MKYTILMANSFTNLIDKVNDAILKGWKPTGGISVAVYEEEEVTEYFQAMVGLSTYSN